MSAYTTEMMINHHGSSLASRIAETLTLWRRRSRERAELAQWGERELHDIGLSASDAMYETSKPFWRA